MPTLLNARAPVVIDLTDGADHGRLRDALGGKVTGAGGGGFMLVYCDVTKKRRVAAFLTELSVTVEELAFTGPGRTTWSPG